MRLAFAKSINSRFSLDSLTRSEWATEETGVKSKTMNANLNRNATEKLFWGSHSFIALL